MFESVMDVWSLATELELACSGLEVRGHHLISMVVAAGLGVAHVTRTELSDACRIERLDGLPGSRDSAFLACASAAQGEGVETLFGDISDPEFAASLPLNETDAVICSVHDRSTNLVLLETLTRFNFDGRICLTAMDDATAKMLSDNANVTVIRPLKMAANRIVDALPRMRER